MSPLCIMPRSSAHDLWHCPSSMRPRACYLGCPLCEPMAILSIAQVACARRRATWVARDCSIKARRTSSHHMRRCSMSRQAFALPKQHAPMGVLPGLPGSHQNQTSTRRKNVQPHAFKNQSSCNRNKCQFATHVNCTSTAGLPLCVGPRRGLSRLGASTGVWTQRVLVPRSSF